MERKQLWCGVRWDDGTTRQTERIYPVLHAGNDRYDVTQDSLRRDICNALDLPQCTSLLNAIQEYRAAGQPGWFRIYFDSEIGIAEFRAALMS